MPPTSNLLSLPLEVRHQIYSYLLPAPADINMVRDDMDGPTKTDLFRICQQIYYEVFQYYHSINTFVLDLTSPEYAPNRFVFGTRGILRYFRRVQDVRLVIGDFFPLNDDGSGAISDYTREQLDWFFAALRQANRDRKGPWLRNLTVQDLYETRSSIDVTEDLLKRGERRREILISFLEPLRNRVGSNLRIDVLLDRESVNGDAPLTLHTLFPTS